MSLGALFFRPAAAPLRFFVAGSPSPSSSASDPGSESERNSDGRSVGTSSFVLGFRTERSVVVVMVAASVSAAGPGPSSSAAESESASCVLATTGSGLGFLVCAWSFRRASRSLRFFRRRSVSLLSYHVSKHNSPSLPRTELKRGGWG